MSTPQHEQIEFQARKSMRQAFLRFDSDKSGSIEIHELAMLMKRLTESFQVQDPTQEDINIIFRELDVNGDGKITSKEFDQLVDEIVKIVQEESDKAYSRPPQQEDEQQQHRQEENA